jgi:Mycothiol maleylpyruvate isomerase N-terminal domain
MPGPGDPKLPSRALALRILEDGHRAVRDLIDELPRRALTKPGLGGGDWSPKDLIGHLASWEQRAVEALEAWDEGHGPAFDKELWSKSTSTINAEAVERTARLSTPEIIRRADATHEELVRRIRAMSDPRWSRPGTPRGRTAVGKRLGGILGGPGGDFRHADAHLKDLRPFVEQHRRG